MKLETVSRIKGCVALAFIAFGTILGYGEASLKPHAEFDMVPGVLLLVGLVFWFSWSRGRRRARELEYAARISHRG